jgi:hypothetical protein
MYQISVPAFVRGLRSLSAILEKAAAYAAARNIDPAVLISARLAPDMHPLSRQVQIASDTVKGAVARLTGVESPSWPDTETTFAELQARIATTIEFAQMVPAAQFEGSETREVVLKFPGNEMRFTGQSYLLGFVLPNFYFHLTTAYAILRHNGLEIGKRDFIGQP